MRANYCLAYMYTSCYNHYLDLVQGPIH